MIEEKLKRTIPDICEAPYDIQEYYKRRLSFGVSPLLSQTLFNYTFNEKIAIDLGCGCGVDVAHLIDHKWRVIGIDSQPLASKTMKKAFPSQFSNSNFRFVNSEIEKLDYEKILCEWQKPTLLNAQFSLSFVKPDLFPKFWEKATQTIATGGIFCGNFFGRRHGFNIRHNAQYTFLTNRQIIALFKDKFEIVYINEMDLERTEFIDARFHYFDFIVKKVK
jgi:hypothetical protein